MRGLLELLLRLLQLESLLMLERLLLPAAKLERRLEDLARTKRNY
jgi:hypothetical protein